MALIFSISAVRRAQVRTIVDLNPWPWRALLMVLSFWTVIAGGLAFSLIYPFPVWLVPVYQATLIAQLVAYSNVIQHNWRQRSRLGRWLEPLPIVHLRRRPMMYVSETVPASIPDAVSAAADVYRQLVRAT